MTQIGKIVPYWMLISLASCGPATFADLRWEGEAEIKKLSSELKQIETKEDLQKAVPRLRKRFNQMADLLVEVKKFPLKENNPSEFSEELFLELARLYEIPGGREVIELAQSEAVSRLQNANLR